MGVLIPTLPPHACRNRLAWQPDLKPPPSPHACACWYVASWQGAPVAFGTWWEITFFKFLFCASRGYVAVCFFFFWHLRRLHRLHGRSQNYPHFVLFHGQSKLYRLR